jgi:hypothetical protein
VPWLTLAAIPVRPERYVLSPMARPYLDRSYTRSSSAKPATTRAGSWGSLIQSWTSTSHERSPATPKKDGEKWTDGVRGPNEFPSCNTQGCYLWDGGVDDLYGVNPRFWLLPQDGTMTKFRKLLH